VATDAVLDSSIVVALVTQEEYSIWASTKIQKLQNLHALDLSFYEVASALQHKVSENFTAKDATAAFKQAKKIMSLFSIHPFSEVITESLRLALELKTSVYDAAFLALAKSLDLQLLTLDQKLSKKIEQTDYFRLIECPNKKSEQP